MSKDFIQKLKDGKESAFKECVELHKDKVLSTCYHFLQNKIDAEDIAQEVFMEVWQSIHKFKEDASLSTWIYRIAVNKSLDHLKKKKRKKRYGFQVPIDNQNEDKPEIQIANGNTPENILEHKERTIILHNALNKLPENQKVAITLSKYEGYSYKEIAEIMATSVSAVESLIFRGMKNLKKHLSNYYEKTL